MQDDIRQLIRDVLAEDLSRQGLRHGANADTTPRRQIREEFVSIANDEDLRAFAARVFELARDGRTIQEFRNGQLVFRLDRSAGSPRTGTRASSQGRACETVRFERGLVTERQISPLDKGSTIQVGKRVRFTPLALDEIRRRKIHVQR